MCLEKLCWVTPLRISEIDSSLIDPTRIDPTPIDLTPIDPIPIDPNPPPSEKIVKISQKYIADSCLWFSHKSSTGRDSL